MPLSTFATDAFGVVTICLVSLLILLGLLCIVYSFYFRSRIHSQGFLQLSYFCGPWIIRIAFVLFVIWWGFAEILRLSLLRYKGRVLGSLDSQWQETICKGYIVSNLGFAEPCLLLTLVFLLRAPLQKVESGILSQTWNKKTAVYILVYCCPMFVFQLFLILIGPQLRKHKSSLKKLPIYFTRTAVPVTHNDAEMALCTYPLLNTILLGLFTSVVTVYLLWLVRRILKLVINKGLQKRVYTLIFSVSGLLPLRVLFLGLSVLSKPEHLLFEVLALLAFLALACCAGVCICMLVFYPVADALALGSLQDLEARRTVTGSNTETISLLASHSHIEGSGPISSGGNSDTSTMQGSISFRAYEKDGTTTSSFVELSLFSPSHDVTPSGSPPHLGWPMRSPRQTQGR